VLRLSPIANLKYGPEESATNMAVVSKYFVRRHRDWEVYDIRIAYAKDIIRFRSMLGKVTIDWVGILLIISTVTGRFIGSTASIGLYVKSRNLFSRRGGSYGRYPWKHYYIRTLYLLQTAYALSMRHNSRHMREEDRQTSTNLGKSP
jgi:hypothetical protein